MFFKFRLGFFILLSTFLCLNLAGCWDQVEIKERTIVLGVGIDKIPGDEPFLLTVQAINLQTAKNRGGQENNTGGASSTGKSSPATDAVVVETSTGKSFYDAIHNFLNYSSRRITFSHNRIVIFGKRLAEAGISGILDDMSRDYQFRLANWIFVAENTAKEVLESKTDLGTIPAQETDRMMQILSKNASFLPVNRNDLVLRLKSEGKSGLAPLVTVEKPSAINSLLRIVLKETVVFKNNRLIGNLTPDESQGLLWFGDKQKGCSLVVPYPSGRGKQDISVEITTGSTRMMPLLTPDGILIEIVCSAEGTLQETENFANNPKAIARLNREVSQVLAEKVNRTIQKAQQMKADFLGFGRLIHSQYPDAWHRIKKDWDREFPRVQARVRFQVNIVGFGLIKDSVLKPNILE